MSKEKAIINDKIYWQLTPRLRETICQVKAISKQQVPLNKPFIEEYDKILYLQMVAFQRVSPVFTIIFLFSFFFVFCFVTAVSSQRLV